MQNNHNQSPGQSKVELPSFPEEAFVGHFKTYRDLVSPTTESPDPFLWGAFLAVLSVLVGRTVKLNRRKLQTANVMVGLVGKSSVSRKSTAISDARSLILNPLSPKRQHPLEPEQLETVEGTGSGEGFFEAVADKLWTPMGGLPVEVTGRRALFAIHELSELFNKVKRDQAGNMIDFLLGCFDARESMSIKTRTKPIKATNAIAVVLAGTTLDGLSKGLSPALIYGGLMNRFLWLGGDRKAPISLPLEVDPAGLAAFQNELRETLAWANGRQLTVSPEAERLHDAIYREEYQRTGPSDLAMTATSRADVIALKVAINLAVAARSETVTLDHLDAAWQVVFFSRRLVESIIDQIPETSWKEAERRVFEKAEEIASQQGSFFSERQVYQRLKGRTGMPAQTFKTAFRALVQAGDFVQSAERPGCWMINSDEPLSPEPTPAMSTPTPELQAANVG